MKTKKVKSPTAVLKTIELNWAIDANDLGHRIKRVTDFLAKGNRVEVVMAGKRKGRRATTEEARSLMTRVREAVEEVEGAKEWKPMEGAVLGQATLYFEGKAQN
jgi:translation initiation factor IF-3